ncbi:hypothetical protein VitviT2T_013290 [Vitis vinifera]|uniref:non-specific serine/threonine protein kinase n=1 Tax=Vitis vinifera TaxID=29760 RepID=A0ABY9CGK4_VITVI|nr:hypothetical protein VitviT2T_013290 [Vitis vinifera]
MDKFEGFPFALLGIFILILLAHAQDQSGFISIDCGLAEDSSDYDEETHIYYTSDANFIDTGVSKNIAPEFKTSNFLKQFVNVRSFPDGIKNCYTLRPARGKGNKYLIRAEFLYGNYDDKDQLPEFDLHLGVNTWDTVVLDDASNFGSPKGFIRFDDDAFNRFWFPYNSSKWAVLSTSLTIDANSHNRYQPPSIVMRTAATPLNAGEHLEFSWEPSDPTTQFYVYMHFAEVEELKVNQSREFNIFLNGTLWYGPVTPRYLYTTTIRDLVPESAAKFQFSISQMSNSTHPPIINALEAYRVKRLLQPQTDQKDVDDIMNIKSIYDGHEPPRIISLNLSSSGLTGEIAPSISNLTLVQYLDLSNNGLTGPVPDFLSQLPLLRAQNLTGNKLTGSIPVELIERSENGSLLLSVNENPNLCWSGSCKKKKKFVVPIVASVAALFILLTALAIFWKHRRGGKQVSKDQEMVSESNRDEGSLVSKKQQFTYSEVITITNNFEKEVGKGGFGTVYHGHLDDTQVAVKMFSPSSIQGYKQFQAEAKLLMRVHHRNITSLIGYCKEGNNMGLIYEYMANGDLQRHPSERNTNVLSWEERLRIAVETAQGLEYLHNGCKPPIIHRDIKSTNILLNEKFQAKLADFRLSRAFPNEGSTHVSTIVAGTRGYLDPEYHASNRLTEKSDVFSFGVVLLEIITSQSPVPGNHEETHIIQWVSSMLANGDIKNIVDPRLQGDFDINSAWKAVEVAMSCVASTSTERPAMNYVVMELNQCLEMEASRNQGTESKDSTDMVSMKLHTGTTPLAQ